MVLDNDDRNNKIRKKSKVDGMGTSTIYLLVVLIF